MHYLKVKENSTIATYFQMVLKKKYTHFILSACTCVCVCVCVCVQLLAKVFITFNFNPLFILLFKLLSSSLL